MSHPGHQQLTGWDRKTIRKYMQSAGWHRIMATLITTDKLHAFNAYFGIATVRRRGVERAGVDAQNCGCSARGLNHNPVLHDSDGLLRPQRIALQRVYPSRPSDCLRQQAHVTGGNLGTLGDGRSGNRSCTAVNLQRWVTEPHGKVWGWWRKLCVSIKIWHASASARKLLFPAEIGGVNRKILYDRMKTVWLGEGTDDGRR